MSNSQTKVKLLVLMGSFRRGSYSRSIADYAVSALPSHYEAEFAPLYDLPLFCQGYDDEGLTPETWKTFRAQVAVSDALLFVTPEHNRSFPAILKNALDIASRPAGESVWAGKPGAIISVSPGRQGGALCNQHLRQPLGFLDIRVMHQPELYISEVTGSLDDEGVLVDAATQRHIGSFLSAFDNWIAHCRASE